MSSTHVVTRYSDSNERLNKQLPNTIKSSLRYRQKPFLTTEPSRYSQPVHHNNHDITTAQNECDRYNRKQHSRRVESEKWYERLGYYGEYR